MKRYNILIQTGPQDLPATDLLVTDPGARNSGGRPESTRARFAAASAMLHVAAVAAITVWMTQSPPLIPPAETPIEMVFQTVETPPLDPAAETPPPEPLPAVPEPAPPEPSVPEPAPPEPVVPQPSEPEPPAPPVPESWSPEPAPPAPVVKPPPVPTPLPPVRKPKPTPPTPKPVAETLARAARPASPPAAPRAVSAVLAPAPQMLAAPRLAAPRLAAPPPMPAAAGPPIVDGGWQSAVAGWLSARKTYPEEARRRGEEGRVAVRVTVDRSGHILDAAIAVPSGSDRLDTATLALLRGAVLPPFPPSMPAARITITTSMRYSLR